VTKLFMAREKFIHIKKLPPFTLPALAHWREKKNVQFRNRSLPGSGTLTLSHSKLDRYRFFVDGRYRSRLRAQSSIPIFVCVGLEGGRKGEFHYIPRSGGGRRPHWATFQWCTRIARSSRSATGCRRLNKYDVPLALFKYAENFLANSVPLSVSIEYGNWHSLKISQNVFAVSAELWFGRNLRLRRIRDRSSI
jgi:hypothetical protein